MLLWMLPLLLWMLLLTNLFLKVDVCCGEHLALLAQSAHLAAGKGPAACRKHKTWIYTQQEVYLASESGRASKVN
jgi:hypothetical protein